MTELNFEKFDNALAELEKQSKILAEQSAKLKGLTEDLLSQFCKCGNIKYTESEYCKECI